MVSVRGLSSIGILVFSHTSILNLESIKQRPVLTVMYANRVPEREKEKKINFSLNRSIKIFTSVL